MAQPFASIAEMEGTGSPAENTAMANPTSVRDFALVECIAESNPDGCIHTSGHSTFERHFQCACD